MQRHRPRVLIFGCPFFAAVPPVSPPAIGMLIGTWSLVGELDCPQRPPTDGSRMGMYHQLLCLSQTTRWNGMVCTPLDRLRPSWPAQNPPTP